MAENEKLQRVKEKFKENKTGIIFVGVVLCVLGFYEMTSFRHANEVRQSNIGTAQGAHTDATKPVNASYRKALNVNDRSDYKNTLAANKSGKAETSIPSLTTQETPPPNNSQLAFDNETGVDQAKSPPLPKPKPDEPPKQKKAPDIDDIPLPTPKPHPAPTPAARPIPSYQPQAHQIPNTVNAAQTENHDEQELQVEKAMIAKVVGSNAISIDYGFKSASPNYASGAFGGGSGSGGKNKWNAGTAESLAAAKAGSEESTGASFTAPAMGTVVDAEMAAQVTSYSNGPVFASITSGRYAGARVIGTFAPDQNQQGLTLKFSRMSIPYTDDDGDEHVRTVSINAIGVEQGTMKNSVATSVDRHFLLRASYSLATSFMQGLGQAIQQSGSTATSTSGGNTIISQGERNLQQELLQAGGQAASNMQSQMQQFMQPYMNTEIRIEQGTPFQIIFMDSKTN